MSGERRKEMSEGGSFQEIRAEDLDEENLRIFQSFDEAARAHPLVIKNGIIRFKEDPGVMEEYNKGNINLNAFVQDVLYGRKTAAQFLAILRATGSSLDHYASVLQTPGGLFHVERAN